MPEIFNEYYRTSDAVQYNQQSTGPDLAIVKEVMQHLNLTIRVESKVSKGTVFYVMIPKTGNKKGGVNSMPKIRIIDDDNGFADDLTLMLENAGHQAARTDNEHNAITDLL